MTWSPPQDRLWYPPARRRSLPSASIEGRWASKPIGTLNHFTAGCGDPYATLAGRGLGVQFTVDPGGDVNQYMSMGYWCWHAREASLRYVGIEHTAYPGHCELTTAQLEASAKLNAWILKTLRVQAIRSRGVAFTPGIKAHFDGLQNPAVWNSAHHWDGIWKCDVGFITDLRVRAALNRSPWTWARYVGRVRVHMGAVRVPWPGVYLKRGMRSPYVEVFFRRLRHRYGARFGPFTTSPSFGGWKDRAVRRFQRAIFPADPRQWDGVIGPKTWRAVW